MAATRFLDHMLSGTAASRPAASATPQGALYFATDTGVISRSDGTSTWTTLVTAGGIPATLLDAKGDLIVASAADTAAKLTAGTNGYVLTANSAATNGVEWAAASGGGSTELEYTERSTDLTVTATTSGGANTWITGGSLSYDGSTRVLIEAFAPMAQCSGGDLKFELWDATSLSIVAQLLSGTGGPIPMRRYLTPSAASHTYSIRAWKTAGTSFVFAASPMCPGFLRISTA